LKDIHFFLLQTVKSAGGTGNKKAGKGSGF